MTLLSGACLLSFSTASLAENMEQSFDLWLDQMLIELVENEAISKDFSKQIKDVTNFRQDVVDLDRKQPEGSISFEQYKQRILTQTRIAKGRKLYHEHYETLSQIGKEYGIQPQYLVALWGIETNFGGYIGKHNVFDALATLAYDGRRRDLFERQFRHAAKIAYKNDIAPEDMIGSWAGAMGQSQFMPTTFVKYAVDQNKDGKIDLWKSLEDVFGSSANYLTSVGWAPDTRWGRQVKVPKAIDLEENYIENKVVKTVNEWSKLGVVTATGGKLPNSDIKGRLVQPGNGQSFFLVYQNYETLLDWNRSTYFATTVGLLADEIAKK